MSGSHWQLTIDAADPLALGQFWCAVLGYVRETPPDKDTWEEQLVAWGVPEELWNSRNAIVDPQGLRPRIILQQVPEGKLGKNRLVELGATRVGRVEPTGDNGFSGWLVLQDPEGNEFCLV